MRQPPRVYGMTLNKFIFNANHVKGTNDLRHLPDTIVKVTKELTSLCGLMTSVTGFPWISAKTWSEAMACSLTQVLGLVT